MKIHWFPALLIIVIAAVIAHDNIAGFKKRKKDEKKISALLLEHAADTMWRGWNKYQIVTGTDSGNLVWYGHELIANTSYYLGPEGIVAPISNGMNCQNCHLEGGTVPFGNNFGKVYATYPKFRARNNGVQTIYDRINDCLERSLNGKTMDSSAHEMQAIYAYIKWLGEDIPKGAAKGGTSLMKLTYLDRAADTIAGKQVYLNNCQTCHGANGKGQLNGTGTGYVYPPVWGEHSYNDGAGLYRISSFASFVKNNMPFGADYHNTKLTDEQAWDVAAFVNSRPRPHKDQTADWHDIAQKPIDFPYGPYADGFTEEQHKFGPFQPIKDAQKVK